MLTHLYELLEQRAARFPSGVALGNEDGLRWKTVPSTALKDAADQLAVELRERGVQDGDRVILWLPSRWLTLAYYFAIWKLGATVVPFDREMNPEGGARIIDTVEPRLILVGHDERPGWARGQELVEWWEPGSRSGADGQSASWERPLEELAVIAFTSGTTGSPKGCEITHRNLCSQVDAVGERIPLGPDCRLASILPLSHLLELTGELYALSTGAAIHYVPSRRAPDVLRVLQEQRITHMVAVPQLLTMMGRAIEEELRKKLPTVVHEAIGNAADRLPLRARRVLYWPVHQRLGGHFQLFLSGGAALPTETHHIWERFGVRVVQGFGTSECSPVVTLGQADGSTPIGSVGKAIRAVELRIDPAGELLVRGPNVMRGYWRDPGRTAEAFRDGWYATGDVATLDTQGNVRIIGRARELIVLPSGLLVWPEDVEDVLRSHPAVKDAAILAVPTAGGGATLHGYLIPASAEARQSDIGVIVAACNARLAQHQRLATASWWPEVDFPRTALMKVRRHLLPPPESSRAVTVESVMAADDPVGQAIASAVGAAQVEDDSSLMSLGLDSLGLVDLALALEEKTGKAVADGELLLEMTVAEVRSQLAAAPTLEAAGRPLRPGGDRFSFEPPLWAYTWGRIFRVLGLPWDLVMRLLCTRLTVRGGEHLRGLSGPIVLAGTHRSFPDTPLVRAALARYGGIGLASRLVPAIVANPNMRGPWAAYGTLALGLHPLSTQAEREASLRALVRVAHAGGVILIFPQGTHATSARERSGDPTVRFKPGVAHLAEALEASVVPFGVAGTARMMPPSAEGFDGPVLAGLPVGLKRGPLAIAFGPPIRLQEGESLQEFTARLELRAFELTEQADADLIRV